MIKILLSFDAYLKFGYFNLKNMDIRVEKGLSSDYQVLHAGNGIDENDKDEFDSVLAEAMQAYLKITMETDGN